MGNLFARDDLFDYKGGNIKTDDISSTIPYLRNLDVQAKKLVGQLDTKINYNNKSLVLFNESDNFDMYKLFEKSTQSNNNNNNFSETSPFISSDVYNQLLNTLKNKQAGGAKKTRKHKKSTASKTSDEISYTPSKEDRDDFEEESSTSSESSESDEMFDKKSSIEKTMKKHNKKDEMDIEPEHDDDEFSPMSHGMSIGSYVSSSAHSDNISSQDEDDDDASSDNSLTMNSTVSVRKQHRNRQNYSESVNTSDINIISVDE